MAASDTRSYALVSATLAPIALIGGWTVAANFQLAGYSSIRQTISALAAVGTPHREVMTSGLVALGVCHLITAVGLRPAHQRGRVALASGGLATIAVAAFPQPQSGSSTAHTVAATIGFIALTAWPVLASHRGATSLLARSPSIAASTVLLGLMIWFALALGSSDVGVAERALAGLQSLWPLAVVISTRLLLQEPA
jgi:hypothetical membrane protein